MKHIGIKILTFVLSLAVLPLGTVLFSVCLPNQFTDTYYGELLPLYQRLRDCQKKKIVIIGNSSVAFGISSKLMETALNNDGLDYEVCNFGLYGSIGTKAMLSLAKNQIQKDDIVILAPELNEQALSLYFSASELYRGIESDLSLIYQLDETNRQSMEGSYFTFLAERYSYSRKEKTENHSVYSKSSFDERGDLTNFARPYNTMTGYYDHNNMVSFSTSLLNEEFLSYVNSFYEEIASRGARMFYSFSPINSLALTSNQEEILKFYNTLDEALEFKIISNPNHYIYEPNYFFDTNFHLNEAGMIHRTIALTKDIENEFGITRKNLLLSEPGVPELPAYEDDSKDGDNSFADAFTYREEGESYVISSLKEEGKSTKEITLPYRYQGKKVIGFDQEVFANNTTIEKIVLQDNIRTIPDYSFSGCSSLQGIYFEHASPSDIAIGYHLLDGCPENTRLYLKESVVSLFVTDYTWGYYGGKIETY